MKFILSLLCIFILPQSITAQYEITGTVLDSQQKSIPFATLRVTKQDSSFVKGSTTDSAGVFCIKIANKGDYLLYISSIGYISNKVNFSLYDKKSDLGTVILKDNNILLNEIVVKGQLFVRKEDHIQVIPDKQQVKHAGTGYDLLNNLMIPNIDVDVQTRKVTTFGGDVTLYIDGRKADYREIQNLRPKDVEHIEYYDAPTGKYATDIAAVNYVTKQYRSGGYVSLDGRQYIGYLNGDYNVAAKLVHGNTGYTLFGGYDMMDYSGQKKNSNEHFFFPDYQVERDYNTLDGKVKRNQQYGQLDILNRKEKRILSGKFTLVHNESPDNFSSGIMNYRGHYSMNQSSLIRSAASGIMPSLELYGNFRLKNKQYIETTLRGSYSRNKYDRNYKEDSYVSVNHTKEDFYEMMAGVNYGVPLRHHNSLTFQLRTFYQNTSSHYSGDLMLWQHLWNSTSLFYVEYNQSLGNKFSYQVMPGLSAMYYRLHGDKKVVQYSPRLQGRINYRLAKNQHIFSNILLANAFPNINVLNEVEQTVDFMQVKRGNPDLRNMNFFQGTLNYSLQLGKVNANVIGYYLYKNRFYYSDYQLEGGKLVNGYKDDAHSHTANAVLSLSWKVTDHLRLKADGQFTHMNYYGGVQRSINDCTGSLQASYFWRDFAFAVSGKTTSKILDMDLSYTRQPANYRISAAWSRNNWRVEAGANSPFTQHAYFKYRLDTGVYSISQRSYSRLYQQNGYVKVAYTFDFGRKTSQDWKNVSTNINSAILKAE